MTSPAPDDPVRAHYERHAYPRYPLFASVPPEDTYALSVADLWPFFRGTSIPAGSRLLVAGCGAFSPYPFAVANPNVPVVALDLSDANLARANRHLRFHGVASRVTLLRGDLLDPVVAPGPFAMIDAWGVLHHLADPAAGWRALASRLAPGGLLRVMVYSDGMRGETEAVRRALRFIGVRDVRSVRRMIKAASSHSRFREVVDEIPDLDRDEELADALLHPRSRTYSIDALLAEATAAGFAPMRFLHAGAMPGTDDEVGRLRTLERQGRETPNFAAFFGLVAERSCFRESETKGEPSIAGNWSIRLNGTLRRAVSPLRLRDVLIPTRFTVPVPPLDRADRAFLRRFVTPVPEITLSLDDLHRAKQYLDALILVAVPA